MKFEVGQLYYSPEGIEVIKIWKVYSYGGIDATTIWRRRYYGDTAFTTSSDVPSDWSEQLVPAHAAKLLVMKGIFE
jgi:hypothetical protein